MKRSCKYCGRIHDTKYECPNKPKRQKKRTEQNSFRNTSVWHKKRMRINGRDNYMCQICVRKLYGTKRQYNVDNIEVHHIVPIAEDYDKRLDDSNLICLCGRHHEQAEVGEIARVELIKIAHEQAEKYGY